MLLEKKIINNISFSAPDQAEYKKKGCHTWHKSQPILPNVPLKKRTAITFRLVGKDSIINRTLFEKTIERMRLEGSEPSTTFGLKLCDFNDGETIRDAINAGITF